jgi:hypothetical protein
MGYPPSVIPDENRPILRIRGCGPDAIADRGQARISQRL